MAFASSKQQFSIILTPNSPPLRLARMAHVTEVITCVGQFGFIKAPHQFLFRVYADGKLTATVECVSKRVPANTKQNSNRKVSKNTCVLLNGKAMRCEKSGEYDVKFIVAIFGAALLCRGRLSTRGLAGGFRIMKVRYDLIDNDSALQAFYDSDIEEYTFRLETTQATFFREFVQVPLQVLTTGKYKFHGVVLSDLYHLFVADATVELHEDGTFSGDMDASPTDARRQARGYSLCLKGDWHPSQMVAHSGDYSVEGHFIRLQPTINGLCGTWVQPEELPTRQFVYALVDWELKHRAWSEASHVHFPQVFRQSVKWLLLYSHRRHQDPSKTSLPSEIWRHVLSFTTDRWFI